MQKKHINFALIGCGRISKKHLEAITRIKNATLYSICDIDEQKLLGTAKKFKVKKTFRDYREMLLDTNIDIVNICSPSGLHAEMAIAAAKQKKNVILEKPMALNSADAKKILKAFYKSKTALTVMLQNRFNPPVVHLKKIIPKLGKLLYINAQTYWYRTQSYYNDGWHGTKNMDGGVLMNQATHFVDMIQYLSGKKIKSVSVFGGTFGHRMECEDTISANFIFQDKTIGNIQANTIAFPENFEGSITLFFEKATIRIAGKAMNRIDYWKGFGEKSLTNWTEQPFEHIYGNNHYTIIKNFAEHTLERTKLLIPGSEGLASLNFIEKAYKSLSDNKIINL